MIRLGVFYPAFDGARFDHDYSAAMASEGTGAVMADTANYTDIQPVLQTNEIIER